MKRDIKHLSFLCGNDIFDKVDAHKRTEALPLRSPPIAASAYSYELAQYIPAPSDPVKIICFNFHIFQDAHGRGNYFANELPRLWQIVKWVNDHHEFPEPPSDTYPPGPVLTDTRIRFKLNRVEFYQNQALYTSYDNTALQAAAVARNPATLDQLNVYITNGVYAPNGTPASGVASLPALSPGFDSYVMLFGGAVPQSNPSWQDSDFCRSGALSHEFGHVLDLLHTYPSGGAPASCAINSDFLSDVFGTNPSTCPHACSWGANAAIQEPLLPNTVITNNLMGGNNDNYWTSPLQAAMMHRALTLKSVQRYVATGCHDCASCVAFALHGYDHVSEGGDAVLAYGHVDLNESWGWAGNTFVAPVPGIYHFDVSFVKNAFGGEGTQGDVLIAILKNGTFLGRAWSGNGSGLRGTGCVALNAQLARGDIITTVAQSVEGAKRNFLEYYFSGHLICGCGH